jgi:hypothetical protein
VRKIARSCRKCHESYKDCTILTLKSCSGRVPARCQRDRSPNSVPTYHQHSDGHFRCECRLRSSWRVTQHSPMNSFRFCVFSPAATWAGSHCQPFRLPCSSRHHHGSTSPRHKRLMSASSRSNSPRVAIEHMDAAAAAAVAVSAASSTGGGNRTTHPAAAAIASTRPSAFKLSADLEQHVFHYPWSKTDYFAFARLKQTASAVRWAFLCALPLTPSILFCFIYHDS